MLHGRHSILNCGKDRQSVSEVLAGVQGQCPPPPLRKKILHLVGTRYAISLPIFIKTFSIFTPHYWEKTWLSTEKPLLKMKEQKKKKQTNKLMTPFSAHQKVIASPFRLSKKSCTHPHILPPSPSGRNNERSLISCQVLISYWLLCLNKVYSIALDADA